METSLALAFGHKVEILRGETEGGDELVMLSEKIFDLSASEYTGGVLHIVHCKYIEPQAVSICLAASWYNLPLT